MTLRLADSAFLARTVPSGYTPSDPDAATWIAAIEAADGEPLEDSMRQAYDVFVQDLKTASIYTKINYCNFHCGVRTAAGARIDLKGGPDATLVNLTDSDYDRKTGFTGNSSNKRIRTEYSYPSGTQRDSHLLNVMSAAPGGMTASDHMYSIGGGTGSIHHLGDDMVHGSISGGNFVGNAAQATYVLRGTSRGSSGSFLYLHDNPEVVNGQGSSAGTGILSNPINVFARATSATGADRYSGGRSMMVSAGTYLNSTELLAYASAWADFYTVLSALP